MNEQFDNCIICGKQVNIDNDNCLYINDKCYCAECRETHTRWDEDLNEYVLVDQSAGE